MDIDRSRSEQKTTMLPSSSSQTKFNENLPRSQHNATTKHHCWKPDFAETIKPVSLGELWAKDGKIIADSENDDDADDEDDSDILLLDPDGVVFLPATPSKLRERFDNLFMKFVRNGNLENRNELVCLLDEMKRQGCISEEEYVKFNRFLAQSLESGGSGIGDDEREVLEDMEVVDDFKQLVRSTTEYIIKHDREELEKLNNVYNNNELITLIRDYLSETIPVQNVLDYFESGKVESSQIPKYIQVRYQILLKDIEANRQRVESILRRVREAQENEIQLVNILESLRREELISSDQYERLLAIDETALELQTIADIIRDTKIVGSGMVLLPRARKDLAKLLTNSTSSLKEMNACLDELLRRKAITLEQYREIKEKM